MSPAAGTQLIAAPLALEKFLSSDPLDVVQDHQDQVHQRGLAHSRTPSNDHDSDCQNRFQRLTLTGSEGLACLLLAPCGGLIEPNLAANRFDGNTSLNSKAKTTLTSARNVCTISSPTFTRQRGRLPRGQQQNDRNTAVHRTVGAA